MTTTDIRNNFESTFNELQSLINYATKIEEQKKLQEEFDARLRTREKGLEERERQYTASIQSLKQTEDFIEKKTIVLGEKEEVLKKLDERKEQLRIKGEEIVKKVEENKQILKNLEIRLKEADDLKLRTQELDHRETLLQKEVLADRTRKQELDQKEADLKNEEQRLQKLAEHISNQQSQSKVV